MRLIALVGVVAVCAVSEFDAPAPVQPVTTAPEHIPYTATGIALLDEAVIAPVEQTFRMARGGVRAALEAVVDLLFIKESAAATRSSPLSRPMEGEGMDDFKQRREWAQWLLQQAAERGVTEVASERPGWFRYGLAAVVGVVLLAVMCVVQAGAGLLAKLCFKYVLRQADDNALNIPSHDQLLERWAIARQMGKDVDAGKTIPPDRDDDDDEQQQQQGGNAATAAAAVTAPAPAVAASGGGGGGRGLVQRKQGKGGGR